MTTITCGREYFLNRHYIKYEYSNCLHLLDKSNLLNPESCMQVEYMYKYYKVPCRKFFNVSDEEFPKQCKKSKAFASMFKKQCKFKLEKDSIGDLLIFKNSKCEEGEKFLMGHCHSKTKTAAGIMSWVVVILLSFISIGFLGRIIRSFIPYKTKRKLVQDNKKPNNAFEMMQNLTQNFKNLQIFDKKNKKKILSFLKQN